MLDGFTDYADVSFDRPRRSQREDYAALELYCTQHGYDLFYSSIARTLRLHDAPDKLLIVAVVLVELLTIELYNLRLANIGDDTYANFQGVVYRGMRIAPEQARVYEEIAQRPDVTQRSFSIPLLMTSASADSSIMTRFASEELREGEHSLHLTINIHGVDPVLLSPYLARYPTSVVTSICAMPVARISPFGEKEILLRGAFFHVISLRAVEGPGGRKIHELEAVMMNSNRDHVTETSSDDTHKKTQRDVFRAIVNASKYEVCARLAKTQSVSDAHRYREEQLRLLSALRDRYGLAVQDNVDLESQRSHGCPTWLGARRAEDAPRPYALRRLAWQKAIRDREWAVALETLQKEYDWDKNHWFNVCWLEGAIASDEDETRTATDSEPRDHKGYTALHLMAATPPEQEVTNAENDAAWRELVVMASSPNVWKTVRTFDDAGRIAHDLATAHTSSDLASKLVPIPLHGISPEKILALQSQLHDLMRLYAGYLVEEPVFRLPQISVLNEMETPELWIPVPHWYGGFRVTLAEQTELRVTIFETVRGHTQPKRTERVLHA